MGRVGKLTNEGSQPQCVKLQIQGVPAYGLIDSGADITIMGGILFKKVAAVARFRKRDLKKADKTTRNYDHTPFTLDGRIDMDLTFDGKTMCTPVYIKADAHDQLLLSEGVCRQLGILHYHPSVEPWRGGRARKRSRQQGGNQEQQAMPARQEASATPEAMPCSPNSSDAGVPTVRVRLVQSLQLLPHQGATVAVEIDGCASLETPKTVLLRVSEDALLQVEDALLHVGKDHPTCVQVFNPTGVSCQVKAGFKLGEVEEVEVTATEEGIPSAAPPDKDTVGVGRVTSSEVEERRKKLCEIIGKPELLTPKQTEELHKFLGEHHGAFAIDANERGETDMLTMEIVTGDAAPKRQAARRLPLAVRSEVARQLREMQSTGVVEPSSSPWASPVVMVRKKDGSHRFCVDYRELNAVTKADTFPLPRIDDLLDQLEAARYFTTLDLASGYWQIRLHQDSAEKTAFVTPQGLFQFHVMPFGLTNAPSVFQRLMERVLAGLNPEDGPAFTAVYIDDVIVFSRTLEEHLQHLCQVIQRISNAGLKLKPTKCHFIWEEVEYLGHLITPKGLKTNPKLTSAVANFPQPRNLTELRRFLGMCSYYRRFVPGFAKIASPLQSTTRKDSPFRWTPD